MSYSHETTIEIGGAEFDVRIDFEINEFSIYEEEFGGHRPAEITLKGIYYCDDEGRTRDISLMLASMRDHHIRSYLSFAQINPDGTRAPPKYVPYYEEGFRIIGGIKMWNGYHGPKVIFNNGRTLYEACRDSTLEHVHENEREYREAERYTD